MSRTYLSMIQVAPFIALDILTPLPSAAERAPNVGVLYETRRALTEKERERERQNHRLIADHESRSVEWIRAIHDVRWYFEGLAMAWL